MRTRTVCLTTRLHPQPCNILLKTFQLMQRRGHKFERQQGTEGIWEGLQGVTGWRKWSNYIITSKDKIEDNSERQRAIRSFHTEQSPGNYAMWFWEKVKGNCLRDSPHRVPVPAVVTHRRALFSANWVQYCLLRMFSYVVSGPCFELTCPVTCVSHAT